MEGHETQPPQSDAVSSKGIGKVVASSGASSYGEKPMSPLSLEAIISDLSLFKELPLERPDEEGVSSLDAMYGVTPPTPT